MNIHYNWIILLHVNLRWLKGCVRGLEELSRCNVKSKIVYIERGSKGDSI